MLNKIVVAPFGRQGAGKDYLTKTVVRYCGESRVAVISTGGIMRDVAERFGMRQDRHICNRIVKAMAAEFGGDFLANAIEGDILKNPKEVIVFDCPRRLEDIDMLNRLRASCKVHAVFLDRSQEDRYHALRDRARVGEADLTWEQFLVNEELEQERNIGEISKCADSVIKCFGTNGQLDAQKLVWCQQYLAEYAAVNWDEMVFPK